MLRKTSWRWKRLDSKGFYGGDVTAKTQKKIEYENESRDSIKKKIYIEKWTGKNKFARHEISFSFVHGNETAKKKTNSAKELYEDCRTRKNPLFSNLQILPYEYDLIVQQSKLNFMHAIKFG